MPQESKDEKRDHSPLHVSKLKACNVTTAKQKAEMQCTSIDTRPMGCTPWAQSSHYTPSATSALHIAAASTHLNLRHFEYTFCSMENWHALAMCCPLTSALTTPAICRCLCRLRRGRKDMYSGRSGRVLNTSGSCRGPNSPVAGSS